jgi:hypothetical protein
MDRSAMRTPPLPVREPEGMFVVHPPQDVISRIEEIDMRYVSSVAVFALTLVVGGAALAASIPDTCEATKQKEAGKLAKCLHNAAKKRITTGDTVGYAQSVDKCATKFSVHWQRAEQNAVDKGGACPTTGDGSSVLGSISAHVACVTSELDTGTTRCLTCGNGLIDPGEDCDIAALGGATCTSASGGDLPYGTVGCAADCTFDTSACSSCPRDGAVVGGYCWLLAGAGDSCDTTCGNFGLVYDSATMTYAGSAGTDANCVAVLNALRQPYTTLGSAPPFGLGCVSFAYGGTAFRDSTTATNSYSSDGTSQRVCACR